VQNGVVRCPVPLCHLNEWNDGLRPPRFGILQIVALVADNNLELYRLQLGVDLCIIQHGVRGDQELDILRNSESCPRGDTHYLRRLNDLLVV